MTRDTGQEIQDDYRSWRDDGNLALASIVNRNSFILYLQVVFSF